jgi:hypothetical protein
MKMLSQSLEPNNLVQETQGQLVDLQRTLLLRF